MPLPIPENVFHSYLRRWNNFAHLEFEQDEFLEWINDCVVILRHDIHSQKVQAGVPVVNGPKTTPRLKASL